MAKRVTDQFTEILAAAGVKPAYGIASSQFTAPRETS
jgi:hypothetical protein